MGESGVNFSAIEQLQTEIKQMKENMDDVFLLTNATFVCLMQCGFACLEAGSIRSKNITNIMMKNILDVFISCLAFWLIGYPLAYGEGNFFIGLTYWAGFHTPKTKFAHWFFQFIFAATAATLVSGAAAERCNFIAYLIYSAVISGFIYPIAAHWVWAPTGWLRNLGYSDFAGSGPVHLLGGVCAAVAAILLGPRIGRFDGEKMSGHSIPLIGIGGMILITGFIAFNGGSLGTMTTQGAGSTISIVIVNTVMAGTGGAMSGLVAGKIGLIKPRAWNFCVTLNGSFTGMVSVCASADSVGYLSSFFMGVVGGLIYIGFHHLVIHYKVDDPLDAVAVHFGGGIWGVLAGPIFKSEGIIYGPNKENSLKLLQNGIGVISIFFWAFITSSLMFGILKYFKILRVSKHEELLGLDISKHNEPAYSDVRCCKVNSQGKQSDGLGPDKDSKTMCNYTNEVFQVEHL